MVDRYAHILSFVLEHPWAITRPMLQTIAAILSRHLAADAVVASDGELNGALVNKRKLPQPQGGGLGVLAVHGVIAPRANLITESSGMTSLDTLSAQLREALADNTVNTILLDVDSPGGNVAGVTEFARELLRARTKKPVVAVANYTMASAAYWIGAAATELIASPSAMVGGVGVYAMHEDLSDALKQLGITRTYISAGTHKVLGNETEPLSDEARTFIKARVDEAYDLFVTDVARGRGVPVGEVRSGYGEARTVSAAEALKLKMIDRIATMDETIARLVSGTGSAAPTDARARATPQEPAMATGQERVFDAAFTRLDGALLAMNL